MTCTDKNPGADLFQLYLENGVKQTWHNTDNLRLKHWSFRKYKHWGESCNNVNWVLGGVFVLYV